LIRVIINVEKMNHGGLCAPKEVRLLEDIYPEVPETVSTVDVEQSKLNIEFTLLEVEKENITLMISEKGCYLSAPADNTLYVTSFSFFCPIDPAGVKASYEDGYLKVEIPLREDIKNFIKVPIE
jgi:HSP20 family molecular chaperone IbpA